MRRLFEINLLILLAAISLAACGPVTPIPIVAPTSTLAVRTPVPITPTLIDIPPVATSTPEPRAEDYQLQPWSASDSYYMDLAQHFSADHYIGFNEDRNAYERVFYAEQLVRDSSVDWRETAWKIVPNHPRGVPLPGMRPDEDLFAFLMEDLLNNAEAEPAKLLDGVHSKIQTNWDCYGAQIAEAPGKRGNSLIVPNLFGDHQDAWVFYAGNCMGTAIYAMHKSGGQYRVEKLREWQALEIPFAGYYLELNTADDINNNGIPEVVVKVYYAASGTPPVQMENLELFEWDVVKGLFSSDQTESFGVVDCFDYLPCDDEWTVGKNSVQGIRPIVVRELYATMTDEFGEAPTCDPLVIEHDYLWKNGEFAENESRLLNFTDVRIECQLSWALQAMDHGTNSKLAADLIANALADWPLEMDDMWGAASHDYFALRLGLFYDLHGNEDAALKLIENVAQQPYNTSFDFAPRLASAYLEVREEEGRLQACTEVRIVEIESKLSLEAYMFLPIKKMRELGGYGANVWLEGASPVCDEYAAFDLLAEQTTEFFTLENWLVENRLQKSDTSLLYESQALTVWLISVPIQSWDFVDGEFQRRPTQRVGLLTKTPSDFSVAYIEDIGQNADLSVDTLAIDPSHVLITIKPHDDYVSRFSIYYVAPTAEIQLLLSDYFVDGYIDHGKNEIVTVTEPAGHEVAVYRWNSELDRLVVRLKSKST